MSYSFEGYFRTKRSAVMALRDETHTTFPNIVRLLVIEAVQALPDDLDDRFIHIRAQGHQCNGDYERSSHDIVVEPLYFYR